MHSSHLVFYFLTAPMKSSLNLVLGARQKQFFPDITVVSGHDILHFRRTSTHTGRSLSERISMQNGMHSAHGELEVGTDVHYADEPVGADQP